MREGSNELAIPTELLAVLGGRYVDALVRAVVITNV